MTPMRCVMCRRPPKRLARSGSARSVRDQQAHHVAAMPEEDQHRDDRRADVDGARPGVIHSTIGSTIVATIDPSDTKRVRATTAANAAAAISVGIGASTRTRRSRSPRLCRRGTAATPDRCDRPRPPRRRRPRSRRRRQAEPRRRPLPMSATITAIAVGSPAVRYTLAAPTLPLPTRRRSMPPRALRDEIADRQRADGVADQNGGNHGAVLISGALTNPV